MSDDVFVDYVVKCMEKALSDIDPNFYTMVKYYLESTRGEGLSMAYQRPDEFKKALEELLGVYPARAVEMIFLRNLSEEVGKEVPDDFVKAIEFIKTM